MDISDPVARNAAREMAERVRHWPKGLVCPWCGGRERVVVEVEGDVPRLRYECPTCGAHGGYIRTNPQGQPFDRRGEREVSGS